jgi:hypothetical protein
VQRGVLVNAKAALETLGCSGAELEVIAHSSSNVVRAMHCTALQVQVQVQCSAAHAAV